MFVAEMDFPLAPEVKDALQEALDIGETGYVNPHTRALRRRLPTSRGTGGMVSVGAPHAR